MRLSMPASAPGLRLAEPSGARPVDREAPRAVRPAGVQGPAGVTAVSAAAAPVRARDKARRARVAAGTSRGSLRGGDARERHGGRALAVAGTGPWAGRETAPVLAGLQPDRRRMPAPGERSRWGIGGEWYVEPAITPRAARGAMAQWRCRVSVGENLTAARRQAGLTITQVSQQTRIRETIIRGIERDDFSACGGDFYARGHIPAIPPTAGPHPDPLVPEDDSTP